MDKRAKKLKTSLYIHQHNRVLGMNRLLAMKQAALKAIHRTNKVIIPAKTIQVFQKRALHRYATRIQRHTRGWLCRLKLQSFLLTSSKQALSSNIFLMHEAILGSTGKIDKMRVSALLISKWIQRVQVVKKIRRIQETYRLIKLQKAQEAKQVLRKWCCTLLAHVKIVLVQEEIVRQAQLSKIRENLAILSVKNYWKKSKLTMRKLMAKIRRIKQRIKKVTMSRKVQRNRLKNAGSDSQDSFNKTNEAKSIPPEVVGEEESPHLPANQSNTSLTSNIPVMETAEAPPLFQQSISQPLDSKSIQHFDIPEEPSIQLFSNEYKESYMAPTDASLNRFSFAKRTVKPKSSVTPRAKPLQIPKTLNFTVKIQPHSTDYNYLKPTQATISRSSDHTKPEPLHKQFEKTMWVRPITHTESSSRKQSMKKTEFEPCWNYCVRAVTQYVPSLDSLKETAIYPRIRLARKASVQINTRVGSFKVLERPVSNRRRLSEDFGGV